eukprot:GHVS01041232.1.p1 GENE.GHVS01041232.1~~GHVS01041232.1.p1  ORF type:complete len:344 (+),score=56.18 GHVS01041232.1:141-1172(+)
MAETAHPPPPSSPLSSSPFPHLSLPSTLASFWSSTGLTYIQQYVDSVGEQVLSLANPDQTARLTASWALVHLSDVCLVVAAYCLLVFVCPPLVKRMMGRGGGEEADGGRRSVLFGGESSKGRGGTGRTKNSSVMGKFAAEPILLLQTLYNLVQVCLCAYMIKEAIQEHRVQNYSFVCNRFDPNRDGMARVLWMFYFSKVVDFLDTFFIVVRQKWRQLSFLHVYHHLSIFLFYWVSVNVAYDGDIYFTIILNSFVHLVMYFYYFLRTIDVTVPTPIKKTITNLQMIQFLMMNVQAIFVLVRGCPFPPRVTVAYLVYIISLFILFHNFSQSEYGSKSAAKTSKQL